MQGPCRTNRCCIQAEYEDRFEYGVGNTEYRKPIMFDDRAVNLAFTRKLTNPKLKGWNLWVHILD